MPTYKITNKATGQTLRITGDTPPTEQDIDEIFASKETGKKGTNILSSAVDFLAAPAKKLGTAFGQGLAAERTGTEMNRQQSLESAQNQIILNKMKEASDSGNMDEYNRLKGLLDQSVVSLGAGQEDVNKLTSEYKKGQQSAVQGAIGTVAQYIGARAPAASSLGQALTQGAIQGGAQGLAASEADILNKKEYGKLAAETAIGAGVGAALSGALYGIGKGVEKVKNARANKVATEALTKGQKIDDNDISSKLAETRLKKNQSGYTYSDQARAAQFTKYKNVKNSFIDETEVAKNLDDIGLKYNNPGELKPRSKNLSLGLQEIKRETLSGLDDKIDLLGAKETFEKQTSRLIGADKRQADKVLQEIVKQTTDKQGLAGATALDADKLASELGKEASKYRGKEDTLYNAFEGAKNYIREQIDNNFADNIKYTPKQIEEISKYSPKVAQAIKDNNLSLYDINYLQNQLINAQSLADDTLIALRGAGQKVMSQGSALNLPIIKQLAQTANDLIEPFTTPLQGTLRTGASRVAASAAKKAPSLISTLANSTGALGTAASGLSSAAQKTAVAPASYQAAKRFTIKEKK